MAKMEQFKKWYNQFNNSLTSKTEKKMQERAWKAALEWAIEAGWKAVNEKNEVFPRVSTTLKPLEEELGNE